MHTDRSARARLLTTALAGWLLSAYGHGVIAMYDTREDCEFVLENYTTGTSGLCTPDRFAVEELRGKQPQ